MGYLIKYFVKNKWSTKPVSPLKVLRLRSKLGVYNNQPLPCNNLSNTILSLLAKKLLMDSYSS